MSFPGPRSAKTRNMIRLHLIGFTPDLKGLVFSGRRGGKTGTYWVPVNDALMLSLDQLDAAREDAARQASAPKASKSRKRPVEDDFDELHLTLDEISERLGRRTPKSARGTRDLKPEPEPDPEPAVPKIDSKLSPREMQQMLREGKTISDVASQAGVDQEWVQRFVGPVLLEMGGIIQLTRGGYLERPRLGRAGLSIGEAVVRNLRTRKATSDTMASLEDGWDARRARNGSWRVRLRFKHRGKRRTAEWEYSKETREVKARNALAKDLGWWNPPQSTKRAETASAKTSPTKKAAPKKAGAKKLAPKKAGAKKAGAKKKPATKKPLAKKSAASRKKAAPSKGSRSKKR